MRKEDVKTEQDVIEFLRERSEFERTVYVAAYKIPFGKVSTYSRIAKKIGRPGASRAVANAMHNNPLWPVVPCWRVVKADGSFGGEKSAAAARRKHVWEEGVQIENDAVVMSNGVLY